MPYQTIKEGETMGMKCLSCGQVILSKFYGSLMILNEEEIKKLREHEKFCLKHGRQASHVCFPRTVH